MADAEHEIMGIDMVEQQCTLEPATADDVIFGVQSTLVVERWFAETLLRTWCTAPSSGTRPSAWAPDLTERHPRRRALQATSRD